MFSVSEISAGLMKPLFNSTRKGTEAFITSSNEQTSIDRKKKKKEEEAMSELPDLKYIYMCVCVCVCVYTYIPVIQNGALLSSGSILTLSKLT